jgi:hypothetical protein
LVEDCDSTAAGNNDARETAMPLGAGTTLCVKSTDRDWLYVDALQGGWVWQVGGICAAFMDGGVNARFTRIDAIPRVARQYPGQRLCNRGDGRLLNRKGNSVWIAASLTLTKHMLVGFKRVWLSISPDLPQSDEFEVTCGRARSDLARARCF